jgi:hypothetical protein
VLGIRLEERRKGFCGYIFLGFHCSEWSLTMASRYLEVAAYAEGGRKWVIWLLEGREGWVSDDTHSSNPTL